MTEILKSQDLKRAIQILKNGGLVAFPTETVYGLGADAKNVTAVRRVFSVKNRDFANPLHVNIAEISWMKNIANKPSLMVQRAMEKFLPGPLTIILPLKDDVLPKEVTGGLSTVGFRIPNNDLALSLIREVGFMVGPSANTSGNFSPTSVEHVLSDLAGKIEAVLDGGDSIGGLESTVLDVSNVNNPLILRSGAVTKEDLQEFFPNIKMAEKNFKKGKNPHLMPVPIVEVNSQEQDWEELITRARFEKRKIGLLASAEIVEKFIKKVDEHYVLTYKDDVKQASKNLFAGLRMLEEVRLNLDIIFVQTFTGNGLALAYHNRLLRY
ncbi:MAG: threonylcarbamoyl-AMP synthase [Lactobacillales bacterium]|nr:threonylcarbamoyl-AMP synthase [Lactobacillales bacterium]